MQTSIKPGETSMPLTSDHATEPMVPSTPKRLRPHQDQTQTLVRCPRCDSTHTKFCYYNNYSLSQPRYFCKSCRRYWTKGGTLRNIPIGGSVSRKNKKLSSISTVHHRSRLHEQQQPQQNSHYSKLAIFSDGNAISENSIGLQLSYPESPAQLYANSGFMFENLTIDFMESGGVGRGGGDYEGDDHFPAMVATGGYGTDSGDAYGLSPFGEMMSYYDAHYEKMMVNVDDVKPKVFDLEWRDYQTGCHSDLHGSSAGRNGSTGYLLDLRGPG